MPNWCNNYLELEHEDPAMIERASKAFADAKLLAEFCPVPESLHIVAGSVGDPDEQKKLVNGLASAHCWMRKRKLMQPRGLNRNFHPQQDLINLNI